MTMRTPFPYFGSKRKVAAQIWQQFGDPKAYIEPFCGSLAVLLNRPDFGHSVTEIVNDADGLLVNFWRAVQSDPEAVAENADFPVSATDLTARHKLLLEAADQLQKRLENDSDYFDAKIAGWWVWGMSSGRKFCVEGKRPTPCNERSGLGLQRVGNCDLIEYFGSLRDRLRRVQIHAGDWKRLISPSLMAQGNGTTAILLDPPYSTSSGRSKTKLYRIDDFEVAREAAKWAVEHGNDPLLRIAFCGMVGEHQFPAGWEEYSWINHGGRQGTRDRERIWFSPHCVREGQALPTARLKKTNTKPTTLIEISSIQIPDNRLRKDLGDLEQFAANIKDIGLLQPIGVTSDSTLVFGERRLRACRDILGWKKIPSHVVELRSLVYGEIAENELRKQYTPSERYAIVEMLRGFDHGGDRKSDHDSGSKRDPLTTEKAAELLGLSRDEFFRIQKVVQKGSPELIQAMDAGKMSISAASTLADAPHHHQAEVLAKSPNEHRWTANRIKKQLRRVLQARSKEESEAVRLALPEQEDQIRLYHCPFQELEEASGLAAASVNLICTDIPYGSDFVDQIEELAAFAKRVLVPGGLFVSYVGQHRLNEKMRLLDKHLVYQWICTSVWTGVGNPFHAKNVLSTSIPVLIYSSGQWQPERKWLDTLWANTKEKDWHVWQRPLEEVEQLIQYFSQPGDLVVDPCGGGFTTAIACERLGRRCVSCDSERQYVVRGQERLEKERAQGGNKRAG